jgi:hypothetical protein
MEHWLKAQGYETTSEHDPIISVGWRKLTGIKAAWDEMFLLSETKQNRLERKCDMLCPSVIYFAYGLDIVARIINQPFVYPISFKL